MSAGSVLAGLENLGIAGWLMLFGLVAILGLLVFELVARRRERQLGATMAAVAAPLVIEPAPVSHETRKRSVAPKRPIRRRKVKARHK